MPFKPRNYQRAAIKAVVESYEQGKRQLLLALPTGAGKTVVAACIIEELLARLQGRRVLFLAHRKEIIDQTAEKIGRQIGGEHVAVEQGDRRAGLMPVVVASVQTLVGRLDAYDPSEFGAVIVDECHHSYAKTWLDTIGHFGKRPETLLLGLTATSKRSDGRCVSELFREVAFEITLGELQDLGYLVPLSYFTVEASLGLSRIGKDHDGDFPMSMLGRIMNSPELRKLTIRAWRERSYGKKTIVFCASVAHAEELAKDFQAEGVRAACISGESRDRDRLIEDFRSGELTVLTNFGVLTEGFDEPSIQTVLLCRPTTSPLVYTQCLGRGLRSYPGKTHCTVIDIIDRQSHGLQYNALEASGLKRTWKSQGRDPFKDAAAIAKVRVSDPLAFMRIKNALCLDEVRQILMELDPTKVMAGIDGLPVPRCVEVRTVLEEAAAEQEEEPILDPSHGKEEVQPPQELVYERCPEIASEAFDSELILMRQERQHTRTQKHGQKTFAGRQGARANDSAQSQADEPRQRSRRSVQELMLAFDVDFFP